ncbi:MAG: Uncharacterized protein conserved in bacteria (DUF2320) [Phormidesmis priestleyi Ana]|uniref:Uncharacterized protein conserved in bacteria (DUF2320) n=1 Tax=Phormidesmis priestleyi Ana TaxID=1666911 RepID=A0A0N8KNG4_9CYAN|nr:MAG: Uncharacterized protein conserved in bacteria (DUF2320) [Phormidesmis priestleyi Ana]
MSLFSSSEKAQLGASSDGTFNKTFIKIVPNQTASDRQRQAFGGYQCMLRLGLGLGGLFNLACAPVLASSPVIRSQSWVSTATVRYPEGMNRGNNANALTPISVLLPESTILPLTQTLTTISTVHPPLNSPSGSPLALTKSQLRLTPHTQHSSQQGGQAIAVEDNHRPQFSPAPDALFADTSLSLDASVELLKLLSHPALGHVGNDELVTQSRLDVRTANAAPSSANSSSPPRQTNNATPNGTSTTEISSEVPSEIPAGITPEITPEISSETLSNSPSPVIDDELGNLRVEVQRTRGDEELGILRLLQTAQAPPPPPREPIAFISGRLGFFDTDNAFRSNDVLREGNDIPKTEELVELGRRSNQVFQSGLAIYLFPKLSDDTSLYAIAETSLARYNQLEDLDFNGTNLEERFGDNLVNTSYNQIQLQLGLRQRLLPRTYAQIGWRNQRLYSEGYREKKFEANYIEAQLTHRSILSSKTWLDSFYQARLGFANPGRSSRFRQSLTLSLNYGVTRDLRTSLLYQLNVEDYTQQDRFDISQQLLALVSYNLTPESRFSVFGGTRSGRSSGLEVNLDDTFYGAGINVNVPLF